MNRARVFFAIAAVVIVGSAIAAFAVTAQPDGEPGVPIVAAEEPTSSSTVLEEPSTTTVLEPLPDPTSSTTSTTEAHDPTPTTSTTELHEPTTTIPHGTTTTTEAPRPAPAGPLHLACATPAPDGGPSSVVCEWNDAPPGSTRWVLMRERTGPSQPLWETTDLDVHRQVDDSAEAGVSYAYRISAYNGDTFLATSNPVRLVAGGEG